jgi:hypothetical protein
VVRIVSIDSFRRIGHEQIPKYCRPPVPVDNDRSRLVLVSNWVVASVVSVVELVLELVLLELVLLELVLE